jgi:hypothetical protein
MAHIRQPDLPESYTFPYQSNPGPSCLPNTQAHNIVTIQLAGADLSTGSQEENGDNLPAPSNPPTPQDWQLYRNVFTRLYSHEDRPLKEVRSMMEHRYKFYAS